MTEPSGVADVIVLGAGLQGVCAALALAHAGHRVTVVDAAGDCLQRASLRTEAKIHLGLVYANDTTGKTAELMLDGALRFGDLLERWVGRELPWARLRSRPFTYVVLDRSIVPATELFEFYARVEAAYAARAPSSYVGTTPRRLWWEVPVDGIGTPFAPDTVAAAVGTAEVSLDSNLLGAELRSALHAHPAIQVRYGHTVHEAARRTSGFRVAGIRGDGTAWSLEAPVVVNCLWAHRLGLDAQLGIVPSRRWVYRLKYRVLGRLPAGLDGLPSATFVLGRFGDIAVYPGRQTYLSWYPACLAGWETSLVPPPAWDPACSGPDDRPPAQELARAAVAGLAEIMPALAGFRVETVDAGVIAAWGTTDIDDPVSELHERHDIGIHAHDGWYSIDTGKFTTAPMFADELARVLGPPA